MIILDEEKYAQEILGRKSFPKLKNLIVLAKYYKHIGKNQIEIKNSLYSFCKERESTWNEIIGSWKIKIAIEESERNRLRIPNPTPITKKEISEIRKAGDYSKEKILFVLLVFAKFLKYNNTRIKVDKTPRIIGKYYVNESFINILKYANVRSNKKQRDVIMHELYSDGYIDGTIYNSIIVKFVYDESPVALSVSDYDNIVLAYDKYLGKNIEECECGKLFVKKTKRYLCTDCQKEKRLEDYRDNKRRNRANMSTD